MKNTIENSTKFLPLFGLMLVGCGNSPSVLKPGSAPSPTPTEGAQKQDANTLTGAYESQTCFLDRTRTVSERESNYATAKYTFNEDRTVVAEYTYFSDDQCAKKMDRAPVPMKMIFVDYSLMSVTGKATSVTEKSQILVLKKPSTEIRNPRLYIPMAKSPTGLLLSLDYLQSASAGPFVTVPDEDEVVDFTADPIKNTVEFKKL